jgi:hypothetical protein
VKLLLSGVADFCNPTGHVRTHTLLLCPREPSGGDRCAGVPGGVAASEQCRPSGPIHPPLQALTDRVSSQDTETCLPANTSPFLQSGHGCEECGFEYDLVQVPNVASSIVAGVAEFAAVLSDSRADVLTRREPTQWSPLEYGCHLRDVLLVHRERVLTARRRDRPSFKPMGRDERVDHDGYAEQRSHDVAVSSPSQRSYLLTSLVV